MTKIKDKKVLARKIIQSTKIIELNENMEETNVEIEKLEESKEADYIYVYRSMDRYIGKINPNLGYDKERNAWKHFLDAKIEYLKEKIEVYEERIGELIK